MDGKLKASASALDSKLPNFPEIDRLIPNVLMNLSPFQGCWTSLATLVLAGARGDVPFTARALVSSRTLTSQGPPSLAVRHRALGGCVVVDSSRFDFIVAA